MIKILIIFFVAILLISCSNNPRQKDVFALSDNAQVHVRGNKKIHNQYEQIFKITDFNDISFANPIDIEISGSAVYIRDGNSIYVFDKEGNYQNKVGSQGKGPGEFQSMKDFAVEQDKIYCLDKEKMSLSIFSVKDLELIAEKRIPNFISENISLENVSVYQGDIYISGFAYPREELEVKQSILYKLDKEFNYISSYFSINDDFAFKSVEDKILMTANVLSVHEGIAYMGMIIGDNLLYAYDLNKNNYLFKISKQVSSQKKYNTIEKERGGVELMSLYNTLQIGVTENYIIMAEEGGNIEGQKENSDYYNNLSFYSKDGKYLFSFEDRVIPYSVYGISGAVEELKDGFHLYIVSPEECAFYKYYLSKSKKIVGNF